MFISRKAKDPQGNNLLQIPEENKLYILIKIHDIIFIIYILNQKKLYYTIKHR